MRVEAKISVTIGVACAVVIAVALAAALGTRLLIDDAAEVAHGHNVRAELQAVSRHTNAAKADLRDFLLTNDSAFLRQHARSLSTAEISFLTAERLTTDDSVQQSRLASLRRLLDQRESSFVRTVALSPSARAVQGPLLAQLRIGESLSTRIDSVIVAADTAEGALLAERLLRERSTELFVVLTSVALIAGVTGLSLLLLRSIQRDLSSRERASAELRASEAKFSGILDVAVDAIISIDERGSIVHFNRGARSIFGYEAHEALGQPLSLLLPSRHHDTHPELVSAFGNGQESARAMGERRQIHGRRKNGEQFDAEASISKLDTLEGTLFTAVLRDVTERKRQLANERTIATASVELARSLDYETTLHTAASLPVPSLGAWCLLDVAEVREDGEPALRRVVSRHDEPALDQMLQALEAYVPDWDSPEPFVDVFRKGEALLVERLSRDWLEAHYADERRVELMTQLGARSLLLVPLKYHTRTVGVWTIGITPGHLFDTFDQNLAEALAERAAIAVENARLFLRAQRASEARDRVMSMVSHDLRGPLAAITMFARQLADAPVTEARQRAIGTNILTSAQWMGGLMQDLLDVASLEAGRLSIDVEPHSVRDLIESGVGMLREQAAERQLKLETSLPSHLPLVCADAHRVQQVLGNLIGNALKFTPADGEVKITATQDQGEVTIRVQDTGPGIPPSELPHVFDRFWHARRGAAMRGTGLGLAIVQGIVRLHGGRVWAESVEGQGSSFSFTLPVYRPRIGLA